MADVVKAALDVAFEHPAGILMTERFETLFNSICAPSSPPEAEGNSIRKGFRNRIECQQIQRLHGSIPHRRNPQGSKFSIGLRNVNSPQRHGMVAPYPQ